jgi:hypothetical protein
MNDRELRTARIGTDRDIDGILNLQSLNLYANLSADELDDGFVTTPFTPDLIRSLLAQDGVFVAESDRKVVGYVLAGGWDFYTQWEIFRVMIARMPKLVFLGRDIDVNNSFQYGPVCVARSMRGTETLSKMFAVMRSSFASRYPIGITFINRLNQRSLAAHHRKLGMEIVDEFEFNGNSFYTLAFSTVD